MRTPNENTVAMKQVLMVLESEFPTDERVEKEIATLKQAGYGLSIATYTFTDRPLEESYRGYTIYRRRISRWTYKSSAAALLLPFYFRFWRRFLNDILRMKKFDVIHVHDLPLSSVAYGLAHRYNLKLVCDQHEFYSNWIVRTRHLNTFSGKLIRLLSHWDKYEKKYLNRADLVLTVEDSLRNIYIGKIGLLPENIVTLPNTPGLEVFGPFRKDPELTEKYRNRFVLFYAGGLDHLRGIEFIVSSLGRLKQDIPEVLFLLAGKENRSFSMTDIVEAYGAKDLVDFVGWIPLDKLSSYMAVAHVCLFLPRADNLEINNTIVTKIYQYMAMGKPIIVSEAKRMKEFVESNGIGYSVPYGDSEALCSAIGKIHDNPGISHDIFEKGTRIAHLYSWEYTTHAFVEAYQKLAQ